MCLRRMEYLRGDFLFICDCHHVLRYLFDITVLLLNFEI